MRNLRGIELRYVLTWHLALHGTATVTELVDALEFHGFGVASPAPKSVSDPLRWERRRLRRALYGPGQIPRGTEHRIHQRVLALRAEANRSEVGTSPIG
jgi:hypothetical protein